MRYPYKGKVGHPFLSGRWEKRGYELVYLNIMMNAPYGAPYTLDQAFPFVKDALIAFGFSGILFQSDNGFGNDWHNKSPAMPT